MKQSEALKASYNILRSGPELGITEEQFDMMWNQIDKDTLIFDTTSFVPGTTISKYLFPSIDVFSPSLNSYLRQFAQAVADEADEMEKAYGEEDAYSYFTVSEFTTKVNARVDRVVNEAMEDMSLSGIEKERIGYCGRTLQLLMSTIVLHAYNAGECMPDSGFEKKGWFKKLFRKVVNAVTTIVVRTVVNTVIGAFYGAGVGLAFGTPYTMAVGAIAGGAIGAVAGIVQGINDVSRGNVICVLPCR